MTCLQYKPLLDDFADNELSPRQVSELETHLEHCPSCRSELSEIRRLKELLYMQRPPTPDKQYWEENESLIFARTIESDNWMNESEKSKSKDQVRSEFFRAILSAAAALTLLAISIFIGSSQTTNFTENNPADSPIFVLAPIEDMAESDKSIILTKAEQLNHIKGMLLLGPPGTLGRLSVMFEYNRLNN